MEVHPRSAFTPSDMSRLLRPFGASLALALFAACASEAPPSEMAGSEAAAEAATVPTVGLSVTVEEGADGTSNVVATLTATNVTIVPAGDTTSGTGHHHLYLNTDLSPIDQPVPSVLGSVVHLGDGSSTYTFEGVEPGEHRMIAVLADGVHVPLDPWVVDTVEFTVR